MSQVKENIRHLKALLPPNIELVTVSKTKSIELILEVYEAGQRSFGENYVQEFAAKQPMLPGDIQWHFIGHLQSNKVRQIAPFVHCIHSIDSEKLVLEVQKQAAKAGRTIKILLQVHVATEETKFGWDPAELLAFVAQFNWKLTPNVEIVGVMGMASFSEDETLVRSEFRAIRTCFDQLKKETFAGNDGFNVVSMGMSGDWNWAIEEGSTLIRLGSAIFGARN